MIETIPFISRQIGWMKCIACSDNKLHPGIMWLGHNSIGADINVTCPECSGTGQVPQYEHIDVRTGQRLDYEKPNQKFVMIGAQ